MSEVLSRSRDSAGDSFEEVWKSPPGWRGWIMAVNNQPLGQRFMMTSFVFFMIGGLLALVMRVQLAVPDNSLLGPQIYNQLFTMHGSIMMFLFAVPFLEGLAVYLLPMMIGSRDVAFPRLTAFSYWTYLFGGLLFLSSFFVGTVPDGGWFGYVPLTGPQHSGINIDFWLLGLTLVEVAGITAGLEIVVTILKFRAPGMTLLRMPVFVWSFLVAGVMILVAFTTLLAATVLLELDRSLGTRFFVPERGGSTLLWQHLFWFFGHPEVYIMFLPATGIVSSVVPAFARRPLAAYPLVVMALIVTGFVSFGLWVHHMFTTGLPELSMAFFTAASLMIAVASGTQVFAWIATLWGARPALDPPLLFVLGFIFIFVLGGFTGVMVAIMPFDWQVHDTYFIVAHLHYVLIGGVVFPILAGLHYWIPKITGRMLGDRLSRWSFWLTFIGFNVTFFPMHIMGMYGMPRRVYTYPRSLDLGAFNFLSTLSALFLGAGFLLFFINVLRSARKGQPAPPSPWNAGTLEWSTSSPPPIYSFHAPPVVRSRYPEWGRGDVSRGPDTELEQASLSLAGEPHRFRATLVTDSLNAQPQAVQYLPGPTHYPFLAAVGLLVLSLGVLLKFYFVSAAAAVFTVGVVVRWLWPDADILQAMKESRMQERTGLSLFSTGSRSTSWWAVVCTLVIAATIHGVLFFAYFYIRLFSETWPQFGFPLPRLGLSSAAAAALVGAGGAIFAAGRKFHSRSGRPFQLFLVGVHSSGLAYLVCQILDLAHAPFGPQASAYASLFFILPAWQVVLVLTGLLLSVSAHLRARTALGDESGNFPLQLQITKLFWYYIAATGVLTYAVIYLSPRVI